MREKSPGGCSRYCGYSQGERMNFPLIPSLPTSYPLLNRSGAYTFDESQGEATEGTTRVVSRKILGENLPECVVYDTVLYIRRLCY